MSLSKTNNYPLPFLVDILLGSLGFVIAFLNLIWVHPVPALVIALISSIFIPAVNRQIKHSLGFSIPWWARVLAGICILWFTMGISDLGEILGF